MFEVAAQAGEDEGAESVTRICCWLLGWELDARGERKALGREVVGYEGEGRGGEEVCGDVEVAGVGCAEAKGGWGEAVVRDMGKSGGEDGGFGWRVWVRVWVLVRVVGSVGGQEERPEGGRCAEEVAESQRGD